MSTLFKMYLDTDVENTKIKFAISFNRTLTNWATSQPMKVGYRVTATPVKISKHENYTSEEFEAFTGFGDTLLEVERQSSKRLEAAIAELEKNIEKYINFFKEKGYKFPSKTVQA